jgi:hypothetical protein
MPTLTLRTIFEESTVLSLLAEPEFAGNYALLASAKQFDRRMKEKVMR